MHPYWKIGDTVLLMIYQGTGGLFLLIDEILSRRDQAASSEYLWLLALSLLNVLAVTIYVKYVDMDHMVFKTVLRRSSFCQIV